MKDSYSTYNSNTNEVFLMEGNEALAEAALRAGCNHFYGYPITPQNELIEYMSKKMPDCGGHFLQAESELAAIHMVFGAAAAGGRAMTSTSSPGISLMLEGLSHLAAAELPCVVVDVMRAGPGNGNIFASQSDYFLATKGGGHGDFHNIVLAPSTVQEMADHMKMAFDLAEEYRNPVMILTDGASAHLMEKVRFKGLGKTSVEKKWCAKGATNGERHVISSTLGPNCEAFNLKLNKKYSTIRQNCTKWESFYVDDAEVVIVAFGIVSRICRSVVRKARKRGLRVGLIRPITLYPFPSKVFSAISTSVRKFLVVEMNMGQMIEDVTLAINGKACVHFYGRAGGIVLSPDEIFSETMKIL